MEKVLSTPVAQLNITPLARRLLMENNILTVADIMSCNDAEDLLDLPRMGRGSLNSILNALEAKGLDVDKLKPVVKRVCHSRASTLTTPTTPPEESFY